jgi:Ca2+-binding RTX toxin-like protein
LRIGTTSGSARANTLEDTTKNRGMTQRTIALLDLGAGTAGTSDGDYLEGNAGNDVILGQGGNDRLKGNAGDDYVEGNQGTDAIDGNAGDDDLVGGSSTALGGSQSVAPGFGSQVAPTDATPGQPDANDEIFGGAGDDLVTGDNAVISRVGPTASTLLNRMSTTNPGSPTVPRFLQLLDLKNSGSYLNAAPATSRGNDRLSGGSGNDVMFGQDGDDAISGGGGDDYLEGNGGADAIRGDLLLVDTSAPDPGVSVLSTPVPETTLPAFTAAAPGWPADADPSATGDVGTGATPAGQDDILGGSSIPGFRDTGDSIEGDGQADFVLGDNGTLARDSAGAPGSLTNAVYAARYPTGHVPANAVIVRHHDQAVNIKYGTAFPSTRFCTQPGGAAPAGTCEVTGAFGNDRIFGDAGDDTLWAQDGDDYLRGGADNDDLYGETGNDRMYGDAGSDAMLGDRGGIVDTYLNGTPGGQSTDSRLATFNVTMSAPPAINYTGFVAGTVDRRVDLMHDIDGAAFVGSGTANKMPLDGAVYGGDDVMRGGTGRDALHGGVGDDVMNGDSGGDTLFGDDGGDVMWGGRGCDPTDGEDVVPAGQSCTFPNDATQEGTPGAFGNTRDALLTTPGTATPFTLKDGSVDYLFGGHGGTSTASLQGANGADLIDWRPRGSTATPGTTCATGAWPATAGAATVDPCSWFVNTNLDDDSTSANPATDPKVQNNQHHQGIDWQYGGWDRDVLQADVADNGPNSGDRLLDWAGAYNLYTHCNAAYGGFNDVRQLSPSEQSFMQKWAFSVGAGQLGTSDITTGGTSAYDELALVYTSDVKNNTGQAYPSTPGHFDNPNACGL